VNVRAPFLWDKTLRQWVIGSWRFEVTTGHDVASKGQDTNTPTRSHVPEECSSEGFRWWRPGLRLSEWLSCWYRKS
jgi:hypothetical protein